MAGLHAGSATVAGVALVAALMALIFLPSRTARSHRSLGGQSFRTT